MTKYQYRAKSYRRLMNNLLTAAVSLDKQTNPLDKRIRSCIDCKATWTYVRLDRKTNRSRWYKKNNGWQCCKCYVDEYRIRKINIAKRSDI